MSVQDKIVEIIAEQAVLEPSDVSLEMGIEELGLDSMGLVETVFAIEENFDVSVPFNANDPSASDFDVSSVQSIVTAVEGLIAAKSA
ncbi:phosphopantetheine-binding protein [Amylibacter ulvae]|uniref:Phosphopantetheine-binding protein n=1 Tax=Paramylibacter ulvae TaxID=1651968 RepID=A0ABQ3CY96_9RHOB|nr:phosphopantetheine-binding protein [Amylibacter ulvae]GHA42415.1 phosphopantetheine-binding protein [Amylibacter ulvae]